jgi:hypothetical protein
MKQKPRHQCLIYAGSPSQHLPSVANALCQKLREKYRCLYLNSAPMVAGMRSYIAAGGFDIEQEIKRTNLVLSSEQGHLVDGRFDIGRMIDTLEGAVNQAIVDGYKGLWATGDMSWEFGRQRDFSKLLDYERELENLFSKYPALGGICQYHIDTLPREAVEQGLMAHQALFINDTLSRLNPDYVPQIA